MLSTSARSKEILNMILVFVVRARERQGLQLVKQLEAVSHKFGRWGKSRGNQSLFEEWDEPMISGIRVSELVRHRRWRRTFFFRRLSAFPRRGGR